MPGPLKNFMATISSLVNKKIYERALELVDSDLTIKQVFSSYNGRFESYELRTLGICELISLIDTEGGSLEKGYNKLSFPEWEAQRPPGKSDGMSWWYIQEREVRKEALRKAIILCDLQDYYRTGL